MYEVAAGQGDWKMLIAMAGLPGTGKSTLAGRLAEALGGVVLDKDQVRAALFPPAVRDYSAWQDDLCMAALYSAAGCILRTFPRRAVVIDGRTFLRDRQVRDLLAVAAPLNEVPRFIACVCADEVAQGRLEGDQLRGEHPAGNRTYDLYLALKAAAEPLPVPHLVVDTGRLSPEECLGRCLGYLAGEPAGGVPEEGPIGTTPTGGTPPR
jgi:adenylylsulfate kinase